MKYLKIAFIFSLALMIFSGCSKEEIQPDSLKTADDISFKGTKAEKGKDHFVPFKGEFDVFTKAPPQIVNGYKYYQTGAVGKVTHLGKTRVDLEQKWWPIDGNPFLDPVFAEKVPAAVTMPEEFEIPDEDPFSSFYSQATEIEWWGLGTGEIAFTAANGDLLQARYFAFSYHPDESLAIIHTLGWFVDGEDGRFADARGNFTWSGVFNKTGPNKGKGTASAWGEISY